MLLKITKILIDMSWFKNPWESANPWAEGKPEFKKAVGTAVDTDEQTTPAVVVDAIKYSGNFSAVMGVEMRKIAAGTALYNEYLKALNDKPEFDTFVFTWLNVAKTKNGISSLVNFDKDGFSAPGGVLAQTFLMEDEVQFKLKTGEASDRNDAYMLQFVDKVGLKNSFTNKKKVILIAIASQYLVPSDYVSNKVDFEAVKKDAWALDTWWDNTKIEFTHSLIHELIAHAIHHLKGDKKDAATEHQNYNGIYGDSSPDIRDVLKDKSKYKGTPLLKSVEQIQSSIQKLYHGKK